MNSIGQDDRNQEGGANTFFQADAVWREVFDLGKMVSVGSVGEERSTRVPVAVPSVLAWSHQPSLSSYDSTPL